MNYDFSGWATKNNLKCADNLIIRKDAFKDDDGRKVPLVWNHQHRDPENVLGHAILENREEGVYAYGFLNDTPKGKAAKEALKHGDITELSIWANQLTKRGNDVLHGVIREVSMVLAGANPGASIDYVLEHSLDEDTDDGEAVIYSGENVSLYHADEEKETEEMANSEKTVKDVYESMNEEQKNVCAFLVAQALENDGGESEDNENMKHNIFENDDSEQLQHGMEMMADIIADAKRFGSMKESALQHGITEIEYLFPEAKTLNTPPAWIRRDMDWVKTVMGGVHHTPFSRIKSMFADITEDEARAKGYLPDHTHRDAKGNLVDAEGNPAYKKEQVFGLLKRTTTPTTVYKKQKLDRDDVIDIVDFDVVAWLKGEMRFMLDEELARAFLVGDGRPSSSDDKINETNIRPIWTDEDLFTIKYDVEKDAADPYKTAKNIIRAAVKSRKKYKGSGTPTLFTTEDVLTDMLLLEDLNGRVIYESVDKLATAMRVSKIVTVPVMENLKRTRDGGKQVELAGIIVNLADYNVGADKGGAVNMFDDFDIDYNAQKYLIETRCSGALTVPYSAIALELATE